MLVVFTCLIFVTKVFTTEFDLLDRDYYDLNQAEEIFEQFIEKYEKVYIDRSGGRLEVFKENLMKYNKWNEERASNIFGVNEFSDMTFEEFSESYLGFNGNFSTDKIIEYESNDDAPEDLDWRKNGYVTEVKSQGWCGSCYVFSAIGNIEGQYAKAHNTQAVSLSAQQALDCGAGDCETGGVPHLVFKNLVTLGGSMRDEDYHYEEFKRKCRFDKNKVAVKVTGGMIFRIPTEEVLKKTLAHFGPLSIGICINDEVKGLRSGKVFEPKTSCVKPNHAVLLIGYGNDGENDFWLVKNSWGTNWGEEGYFRFIRGRDALKILSYISSSIVA